MSRTSASCRHRARRPPLLGAEYSAKAARARVGADIAGDRLLQPLGGDGGAPQLEAGAAARLDVARHEACRLHALDGGGLAHQRARHIGGDIGEQAPEHAVGERIEFHGEEHARPEHADAEGPLVDEAAADPAGIGEGRQQQRVEPDEEARRRCPTWRRAPWPRRHTRPPKKAGANCATAAKEMRPTCASAAEVPIIR